MKKIINIIGLLCLLTFFSLEIYSQYWPQAINNKLYDSSACGLKYIHKGIRVTDREAKMGPLNPMPVTFTINEFPLDTCYAIEKAYVWTILSDRQPLLDQLTVTFTNPQNKTYNLQAVQIGMGPVIGYPGEIRSLAYRADVTNLITTNGNYRIGTNAEDWETAGISLFIIYRDLREAYQGHLVIYDGMLVNNPGYGVPINPEETIVLNAVCDTSIYGETFIVCSDIQKYFSSNDQDSVVEIKLTINNDEYWVSRDFWNTNFFNYNFSKGYNAISIKIFAERPPNFSYNDHIAWIVKGAYYRTNTCKVCPDVLPTQIVAEQNPICQGQTIELRAIIDTSSSVKKSSFQWTSDPPGFFSNEQNPKVTPTQTTKYIVRTTIGDDCLSGAGEITIVVLESPRADAGNDTSFCHGKSIQIGNPATGGTPPYRYRWYPAQFLNRSDIPNPVASPDTTMTFYVEVTDANGCKSIDSVRLELAYAEKPEIKILGDSVICVCDSVLLDAGDGFAKYLWSTGETTRFIYAKKAGVYNVMIEDYLGCKNTSDPIIIYTLDPMTTISVGNGLHEAKVGEELIIPLYISSSELLEFCKLTEYTANISFNKTVLVPTRGTPLGYEDNNKRIIQISGARKSGETLLNNLFFIATLGNSEESPIEIETFEWVNCQPTRVIKVSSIFRLVELCKEGGTRLFDPNVLPNQILKITPNPTQEIFEVEFTAHYIDGSGNLEISLLNLFGEKILNLYNSEIKTGTYKLSFSVKDLSDGIYFILLKVDNVTLYEKLIIVK